MSNDQHIVDFEARLAACTTRGNLGPPIDPEREAESARNTDTVDMVTQVTSQIETVQKRLNATSGFDKKTGAPRPTIGADEPRRRALELQLHHLETAVLPYTRARAAEIDAKKTQLETPEQRLQAEAARNHRLATAAEKRAEEIEVDAMARRILAQRRSSGFAG